MAAPAQEETRAIIKFCVDLEKTRNCYHWNKICLRYKNGGLSIEYAIIYSYLIVSSCKMERNAACIENKNKIVFV